MKRLRRRLPASHRELFSVYEVGAKNIYWKVASNDSVLCVARMGNKTLYEETNARLIPLVNRKFPLTDTFLGVRT